MAKRKTHETLSLIVEGCFSLTTNLPSIVYNKQTVNHLDYIINQCNVKICQKISFDRKLLVLVREINHVSSRDATPVQAAINKKNLNVLFSLNLYLHSKLNDMSGGGSEKKKKKKKKRK